MTETATVALIDLAAQALGQARAYRDTVLKACRERVALGAKAGADADSEQRAMHGYAWVASYLEALAQLLDWAQRLQARGAYSTLADDYLAIGFPNTCSSCAADCRCPRAKPFDRSTSACRCRRWRCSTATTWNS